MTIEMTNHLDNQLTTKTSSNSVMMCHVESLGKRIRVMSLQGWVHGCWSNVGTDHVFCQHAIMSAHLQHVMLPLAEILNVCLRINWYVSVLMFCVYSEDVEIKDLSPHPHRHTMQVNHCVSIFHVFVTIKNDGRCIGPSQAYNLTCQF